MIANRYLRAFTRRIKWLVKAGWQTMTFYRISHFLCKYPHLYWLSRIVSRLNMFLTGADINPRAIIARSVFFAHPQGVVIGGTAVIESRVIIMQGVTLGAHVPVNPGKRHPTIKSNVLLGAHCVVLGDITIGRGAKIGANTTVVESVPPFATVVSQKARVIMIIKPPSETNS